MERSTRDHPWDDGHIEPAGLNRRIGQHHLFGFVHIRFEQEHSSEVIMGQWPRGEQVTVPVEVGQVRHVRILNVVALTFNAFGRSCPRGQEACSESVEFYGQPQGLLTVGEGKNDGRMVPRQDLRLDKR
jgi:hypothetical protein